MEKQEGKENATLLDDVPKVFIAEKWLFKRWDYVVSTVGCYLPYRETKNGTLEVNVYELPYILYSTELTEKINQFVVF